jgi:pyruvate/2-oxoglutarate dehydrogenase complex dihydrolipoamide dehydrogenase (E3) component
VRETVDYDAIIIGSGQAGGPLATALARAGRRTALVEREHVGGTCINVGCTPSKTMVASARVAHLARRAADYGVHVSGVEVDQGVVRARKQAVVESFRNGRRNRIERTEKLDLLMGDARFVGAKTLEVRLANGDTRLIQGENIFINVGGRPSAPPIPGLDSVPALNSTTVMELDTVPAHLLVLGGGYVGLEFAQMFRRFGSEVTLVESGEQLLGREDADVAEEIANVLREDGVELRLKTTVTSVAPAAEGVRLRLNGDGGETRLDGSHLLVAVGRRPNSDSLELGAAGVATDERGFIKVNDRLETNVPGIYALGDVNGGPAFTHVSYDDFRVIRANLLEDGNASTQGRILPYVVFTDPELGRVGLTEREARAQGYDVRVAKLPMSHVSRAIEMSETRGLMKVVVDGRTAQILGASILGVFGGEVMSILQVAMMAKLPYTALRDGIFAHPTLAEALNNLFTGLEVAKKVG